MAGPYTEACDLWSCGVIMYILLIGNFPFEGSPGEILKKSASGQFSQGPDWESISSEAKDLIQKLICLDVKTRLTASKALQHPWVNASPAALASSERGHQLVRNLKSFSQQASFKKAARTIIAGQLKEKEILELKAAFEAIDTDADGTISMREVHEALENMKLEIPQDLQNIVTDLDFRGTGRINYSDFIAGALDERIYCREEVCWNAFKFFDQNNDGSISQEELKLVVVQKEIAELGCPVAALMEKIDANRDGKIQFSEFMLMMTDAEADLP